jgi:hypothetical protein
MKHTIRDDCTHAYVGIALLVTIFMVLPCMGKSYPMRLRQP